MLVVVVFMDLYALGFFRLKKYIYRVGSCCMVVLKMRNLWMCFGCDFLGIGEVGMGWF